MVAHAREKLPQSIRCAIAAVRGPRSRGARASGSGPTSCRDAATLSRSGTTRSGWLHDRGSSARSSARSKATSRERTRSSSASRVDERLAAQRDDARGDQIVGDPAFGRQACAVREQLEHQLAARCSGASPTRRHARRHERRAHPAAPAQGRVEPAGEQRRLRAVRGGNRERAEVGGARPDAGQIEEVRHRRAPAREPGPSQVGEGRLFEERRNPRPATARDRRRRESRGRPVTRRPPAPRAGRPATRRSSAGSTAAPPRWRCSRTPGSAPQS